MREVADSDRIHRFMRRLGPEADTATPERSHTQDLEDVQALVRMGLVDRRHALEYFERIEPDLYRYPAIDPRSFRRAVEETFRT